MPAHKGQISNPTGKGGFQERPQDRSSGSWDSTKSISHQYNKLMRMSEEEFREFAGKTDKTVAEAIAYNRLKAAYKSLPDAKEITDRTEGKAIQAIDHTSDGDKLEGLIIIKHGDDKTQ
jgi:hypothetical protein